ncbi:hypothetical protein AGMMS49925_07890 [Deltaproteobacteria bacterium]|nr:hypothetical protein AGMMS49925_07890 [Deltaproteobacteria bacterium]
MNATSLSCRSQVQPMENDLSRLLQKSLLQVENSLRRFLNLLPGMAYRCVVENNYEYRLAVMFLLAAGAALLFARFSTQIYLVALCGFLLSVFNMAGGFILFSYTAES